MAAPRRRSPRPAPAVELPAAEPAQAPAPEEPAPMSRRARHAKMIEEAAKAEEEWPDLDIEPPIPPRPQFKDASAADEEETKAPFEEESDEEDPLARPLLNKPVELRGKRPPQLSPRLRAGQAPRGHGARGASTPWCRRARPIRTTSFWRMRPTPRTTSPTSCRNIWMITAMRIGRGVISSCATSAASSV